MSLFRRRGPEQPESPYAGLRRMVLELDPDEAGVPRRGQVWGALVDMGRPNGVATLFCLGDGTTSVYTSTGGGVIGAGEHDSVAERTVWFLGQVEGSLSLLAPDSADDPPRDGEVVLRALTYDGRLAGRATEDALAAGHPLTGLYAAAHEVLTAVRLASGG